MKFIIIGLGNFGSSLAIRLTEMGHEVIGVDRQIEKIEDIKDKVTHAICLDCKHQDAVRSLPLKNTDVVVVGIGEDEGANLLTTALIKKMNVPRLISRAVSPLHETILEAMEVSEIVRPEQETAERWANKLTTEGVVDSYEITDKYSIMEVKIPKKFSNRTIEDIGFNKNYNVLVLTTMKNIKERNIMGIMTRSSKYEIQETASSKTLLKEGDIMVIFGHNEDIKRLLKE